MFVNIFLLHELPGQARRKQCKVHAAVASAVSPPVGVLGGKAPLENFLAYLRG